MKTMIKRLVSVFLLTYVVSAHSAALKKEDMPDSTLRQEISTLIQTFPGIVGVYMKDLKTNETIMINAEEPFLMASTYKLPIMIQLFRDNDAKLLSINDQITLKNDDLIPESGLLCHFTPGSKLSLKDLALLMITVSDNSSTDIILEKVSTKRINKTLQGLGINSMSVDRNIRQLMESFKTPAKDNAMKSEDKRDTTTARAMGELIEKLIKNEVATAKSCDDMKNILARTQNNGRIARKLADKNLTIAHKTGTTKLLTHDVGYIKKGDRPEIILVVYTLKKDSSVPTYAAEELIGNIAERVMNHLG